MHKEKAQTTAISHTRFSTTPNSLWMKSALMRTLQQELGYCSFISLIEVLIRCENLSNYVMYSLSRNTPPKLQKIWDMKKRNAKKIVKRGEICRFQCKKMVKSD